MIRIAVVDDDKSVCDQIKSLIERYCYNIECEFEINIYYSCEDLIGQYLQGNRYDLLLLDIEFNALGSQNMSGIELGIKLRSIFDNYNTCIVYVTSFKEYAIDAIKIRPYDYIQKPVSKEKIASLLDSFIADSKSGKMLFEFSTSKSANQVMVSNIRYLESRGRKIIIHTVTKEYEFYGKLSDVAHQDCFTNFIRIHKSYFINLNYVEKFTASSVIMLGINGEELPISKKERTNVSEQLLRR